MYDINSHKSKLKSEVRKRYSFSRFQNGGLNLYKSIMYTMTCKPFL